MQVVLEVGETEVWAFADQERLEQALVNLLHSTARATLPEGVVLVSIENQPDAVVIRVQDSGEGILPDEPSHILDQPYCSVSKVHEGDSLRRA